MSHTVTRNTTRTIPWPRSQRKMMGHRDTRILRRYQKVVDRLKRESVGKLDELLGDRRN
jgi:hypothetical protein